MNKPQTVKLDAYIVRETENAYLLNVEDEKQMWFPKSQVVDNDDGTFSIALWLAQKKGLV